MSAVENIPFSVGGLSSVVSLSVGCLAVGLYVEVNVLVCMLVVCIMVRLLVVCLFVAFMLVVCLLVVCW